MALLINVLQQRADSKSNTRQMLSLKNDKHERGGNENQVHKVTLVKRMTRTNQEKGITAQKHGFLASLITEHVGCPPVLLTIKVGLSEQVKIAVNGFVVILQYRRRGDMGYSRSRGGSESGFRGCAEPAAYAGASTLESCMRWGVLCWVLLNSH